MSVRVFVLLAIALLPGFALAAPPSAEVVQKQREQIAELRKAVMQQKGSLGKMDLIAAAMKGEKDVEMRRKLLDLGGEFGGPDLEPFLIDFMAGEEDSGLQSQAATLLGRHGSERALPVLVKLASSDRTSTCMFGCIAGQSSARRSATFAIAELAERHPKLFEKAMADLQALPDKLDPKDNESLGDARLQALYQISHDDKLLAPFYERLKSADDKERTRGLVAFRYLKLQKAPPEIRQALFDTSDEVRTWATLVLGEIKDQKTVRDLMAVAADEKNDLGLRANAIGSLGRMKARDSVDLLEKLLEDANLGANAAISLYQITGRKVKQFPAGYNAD